MKEQKQLIELFRERAKGENLSLVFSEILNIDRAAAYRRIRLETPFNITEIGILCKHFSISFDRILETNQNQALFDFHSLYTENNVLNYLKNISATLLAMSKNTHSHFTFVAMDLPFFRQIIHPNIRKFMMFYWQKTVLNQADLRRIHLEEYEVSKELNNVLTEISQLYFSVDSSEVWSAETLTSTINRVKYYWESGCFLSDNTKQEICNDLIQLLENLREESSTGEKTFTNINGKFSSSIDLFQ